MAAKKKDIDQDEVTKQVASLSKTLQKSIGQIWQMFVMRYVAKGLAQVFLALFINIVAYIFLWQTHRYTMLIPLGIAGVLIYDAIQLLTNPHYYAANDVLYKVKTEQLLGAK